MPVLDIIRGVAALLVVAGHTRAQVEALFGQSAGRLPAVWKLALFPTSVAQESVAVFFVLSGYLVGGQVLRQVAQARFQWRVFLAKRLSRMWTVLIPGLLFTFLMGVVLSQTTGRPKVGPAEDTGSSVITYVCNAAFGQEARCVTAGTNGSLWSLSYEFWFYVIFAGLVVGVSAILRRNLRVALLNLVVVALAVAYFTPWVFLMAVSWLFGVIAAQWSRGRSLPGLFTARLAIPGWLVLVAFSEAVSGLLGLSREIMFIEVGIPATGLVLAGTVARLDPRTAAVRLGSALGKCSFTMYVFHLPLVALITGVLADHAIGRSTVQLAIISYGMCILIVPVSLAIWWCFERHTGRVRDSLLNVLPKLGP